jgi:hypothetical protein
MLRVDAEASEASFSSFRFPETKSAHLKHSLLISDCNFNRTIRNDIIYLMQNAETINRLVAQGEILLKSFHAECEKDPTGYETWFLRGDLAGWRDTLYTLYHDCAGEIVDRVLANTGLEMPDTLVHPCAPRQLQRTGSRN